VQRTFTMRTRGIEPGPPAQPLISHLTDSAAPAHGISNINIERLDYGLHDRDSRDRFPAGAANFSLHYRCVQNGAAAHPASYPRGTRGSFLGGKAAGA
jgi:hypothetical protein